MPKGKNDRTKWGLPKGTVAKTLRSMIKPGLGDDELDAIAVVLFSHLMIEQHLDRLFYFIMSHDLNRFKLTSVRDAKKPIPELETEREEKLWDRISNMSFGNKVNLLDPVMSIYDDTLASSLREIGTVRNKIMHDEPWQKIAFKGESIWTEGGVEEFFMGAQSCAGCIDKVHEMLSETRELRENWGKRLQELGESLY